MPIYDNKDEKKISLVVYTRNRGLMNNVYMQSNKKSYYKPDFYYRAGQVGNL